MSAGRRLALSVLGVVAVVAAVIGISAVWPGLDARETPTVDTGLWVLQSGDGRRYARVNTAVGELDTVRSVGNPSGIAQSGDGVFLFSESFGKITEVDEAVPVDVDDAVLEASESTPAGTTEVRTAGAYVAYRTDTGALFAGRLADGDATPIDPLGVGEDEDAAAYASDAIAVSADGILYSYSRADASVVLWDIDGGALVSRDDLEIDAAATPIVGGAGDRWIVVDTRTGSAWRSDTEQLISTGGIGTLVLAQPGDADAFYLADDAGLLEIDFEGDGRRRAYGVDGEARGTPARPVWFDGGLYAAWIPQTGEGVLWHDDAVTDLDFAGQELGDQRRPAFVVGTGAIALNETRSGWVWRVPDGALVASSQNWALDEDEEEQSQESDQTAPVVIDPKPPVAEPDAFGARPGRLTTLPVLLNDHDPNTDVLSIDPASVTGLDPAFGTLSVTDSRQRIAVALADGATGSATFSYRVTDGTAADGLYSEPTTVTITAVEGNAAPEWCGVEGCLAKWPQPAVDSGGTVSVPVLQGWVDPDGDPLVLLSVDNPSGEGTAVATPAGEVVYQHSDDGTQGDHSVDLTVTVSDTNGATSTRTLVMSVRADAALAVQSFTVVDTLSGSLTIDVAPHVTGTAGKGAVTSVRVLDDAPATAVAAAGTSSFDFTASEVGTYRVSFTVGEGAASATGIAQITILPDDAPAQLSTAPVVAFVHPNEDVTVDVFDAVSNPTRRVLLLSDVQPAADEGASLSVDTVGQQYLRVSGTTGDGSAGRLGTVRYVVSDGTDDEGARIQGEATVYLLPEAPALAPIAVEDSVVVRAGAQLDIPVLENDVAPSGSPVTLNPENVVSSSDAALAFASGDVIRYLAPSEPGDYTVEYGIYASGSPSLADRTTVRIRVTDDDANRSPIPETLEGRVLVGQTTSVAFDDFGVDPDGDAVFLDGIVEQPAVGTASISADGSSIVYNSVLGPQGSGQQSIRYRVVDAFGATGEGSVRVGVLAAESNPSPVTFTDYVQLQVGDDSSIRVDPLANDIDPFEGVLTLEDVRPDIAPTLDDGEPSPEYERVERMVSERGDSSFVVTAGATPGTFGFLYDVRSESGNTARGLVVVKVVREAVPNYPVVADTVLTAETRDRFEDGVDVVAGKVAWTGGDAGDLDLALWGQARGVAVDGHELSGDLPARTRIIPFSLTAGEGESAVRTYGFLRVPGERLAPLALRSGLGPRIVDEDASVSFDMGDLVAVSGEDVLEVGTAVASGARGAATCTAEGSEVVYEAGRGAPWTDACQVQVRLDGATEWTVLSVPIRVDPLEPQPVLLSGALTVGPGETETFDLRELVRWQGPEDAANLRFAVEYTGARFTVEDDAGVLTITGADSAVPGSEDLVSIAITSHGDVPSARLNLRVGAAPSSLPKGGTAMQTCSQAAGESCTITVSGAAGEVNPLPRTPLALVGVEATGACVGVRFSVASPTTVLAEWAEDAPGATCTASFTMRDAQGRATVGARAGALMLDLQGYPKTPASVTQSSYGDGQLTLRVDPGEARQAYPALTGFVVRSAGAVVASCTAEGSCPVIMAPNGEERAYEAVAVNAIGESRGAVRTVAWAYDVPATPTGITAAPVVTGGQGGVVSIQIESVDAGETAYLEISSPVGETQRVPVVRGQSQVSVPSFTVGANTPTAVTIVPHSRFAVPGGLPGGTSGASAVVTANGIGAPVGTTLALASTSNGDGTSTITAQAQASSGGTGSAVRFGIVAQGQSCSPSSGGASATFRVPDGVEYGYTVCAQSWFDSRSFGESTSTSSVRAAQSTAAPRGYTYAVDPRADLSPGQAMWRIRSTPTSTEQVPRNNDVEFSASLPTTVFGRDPGIQVRYRHSVWGTTSDWGAVTPRAGSAPYQVRAGWSVQSCVGGADLAPVGESTDDLAAVTFGNAALVFYDADGDVLPRSAGSWAVPVGAVRVDGVAVTVDWSAQGWGLNAASSSFGGTCDPNLPPEDGEGAG